MKIVITADLHYDNRRSRGPARRLARRACAEGGDALVLVGDTAGRDLRVFRECLALFADFSGRKLLVPGNHGLWCANGEGSMKRYERLLPAAAAETRFAVLDHQPVVLGRVGLVGSIGWYDYAFRDESLGIPVPFYRCKVSPGAARTVGGYDELFDRHAGRITDRQLAVRSRWMDGMHVELPMSDEEFTDLLARKLRRQLRELAPRVDRIVAFLHHLPFAEMVPHGRPDRFAFAAAYMGSPKLGDVLRACPKVTNVYCGHSHWPGRWRIGHLDVVNVGSTYTGKRMDVLELEGMTP